MEEKSNLGSSVQEWLIFLQELSFLATRGLGKSGFSWGYLGENTTVANKASDSITPNTLGKFDSFNENNVLTTMVRSSPKHPCPIQSHLGSTMQEALLTTLCALHLSEILLLINVQWLHFLPTPALCRLAIPSAVGRLQPWHFSSSRV